MLVAAMTRFSDSRLKATGGLPGNWLATGHRRFGHRPNVEGGFGLRDFVVMAFDARSDGEDQRVGQRCDLVLCDQAAGQAVDGG